MEDSCLKTGQEYTDKVNRIVTRKEKKLTRWMSNGMAKIADHCLKMRRDEK